MTFVTNEIMPFIRRARDLAQSFERNPGSFDWRQWAVLKADLRVFVRRSTEQLYTALVEKELRQRAIDRDEIPPLLTAIRDRYLTIWDQSLNRAFAFADDSLRESIRGQSILQRLVRRLRSAVGLRATSGSRDRRVITYRGDKYWQYQIQSAASSKPVQMVAVSDVSWVLRNYPQNPSHVSIARLGVPVIAVREGGRVTVLDGLHRVAKAIQQGATVLPVRFITKAELSQAKVEVLGFSRARSGGGVHKIQLLNYLKLLFKTLPRQMERDVSRAMIRVFDARPLYRVVGGIVENSADTCRWANGKVFDDSGLRYITESDDLKDHLFHPNCRHRLVSVSPQHRDRIWTQADIQSRVRGGKIN